MKERWYDLGVAAPKVVGDWPYKVCGWPYRASWPY